MQLTIDSKEPLDRVLQVVGSLYGVKLAAVRDSVAAKPKSPALPAKGESKSPTRRTAKRSVRTGGGPTRKPSITDLAAVRSWARANGYQVSDRGRMPSAVLTAYKKSATS